MTAGGKQEVNETEENRTATKQNRNHVDMKEGSYTTHDLWC